VTALSTLMRTGQPPVEAVPVLAALRAHLNGTADCSESCMAAWKRAPWPRQVAGPYPVPPDARRRLP